MNQISLLAELVAYGLTIEVDGEAIRYRGHREKMPPTLVTDLDVHRAEIEKLLVNIHQDHHAL